MRWVTMASKGESASLSSSSINYSESPFSSANSLFYTNELENARNSSKKSNELNDSLTDRELLTSMKNRAKLLQQYEGLEEWNATMEALDNISERLRNGETVTPEKPMSIASINDKKPDPSKKYSAERESDIAVEVSVGDGTTRRTYILRDDAPLTYKEIKDFINNDNDLEWIWEIWNM